MAVRQGSATKLLTASHCAQTGQLATTGDGVNTSDEFIGQVDSRVTTEDVELINPAVFGRGAGGRVYTGGFFSPTDAFSSSYNLPVSGMAHNFRGEFIFTSGALSGFRSNIKVADVNLTVPIPIDGASVNVFPLNTAVRQDGGTASGNGDSGGPVGSFDANFTHVIARGTITAHDMFVTCAGVPGSGTRTCGSRVYFVPITASLAAFGASIITG